MEKRLVKLEKLSEMKRGRYHWYRKDGDEFRLVINEFPDSHAGFMKREITRLHKEGRVYVRQDAPGKSLFGI